MGNHSVDPDLWGFCGAEDTQFGEVPGRQERPGNANGTVRSSAGSGTLTTAGDHAGDVTNT